MRNKNKIFIIATVIAISSIFIYKGAIAPKLYDKHLNTGIKYLNDGEYEEAILAFDKAIKIENKTTEARVYQAEAYIGNEEIDNAVNVLEEAQSIDQTNEELLKEILDILVKIDGEIAYDFLDRFIEAIGKDNISEEIKNLIQSAHDTPEYIIADPRPGKYVSDISVKLKKDQLKVGHSYYYTLDGSNPNKETEKYRGKIDISESTTIKLIGYNKSDESTEVITLEYIIDKSILVEIDESIKESEKLLNRTEVGAEVGNTTEEAKKRFKSVISEVKNSLKKNVSSYEYAKIIKEKIDTAYEEFENNIIQPTDKSKLKSVISEAKNLYDNSNEGSREGQYKIGSKAILLKSINESKKVFDNLVSKQQEIDKSIQNLNNAINIFKNNKVSNFTKEKALQYAISKYGAPYEDKLYYNDKQNMWDDELEEKYGNKRNEYALNKYSFKSNLLIENSKRYYIIESITNSYLDTHVFTGEIKVYEDGVMTYREYTY